MKIEKVQKLVANLPYTHKKFKLNILSYISFEKS